MRIAFADRELDVMTVLWDQGPSTAGEVRAQLAAGGVDLAYNTVLSVLRVLEDKGYVGHAVEGKAHRYHAGVDRAEAGRTAVGRMLDTVFGGSAELLLTHLVRDRRVGHRELARLRQVLDAHAAAPDSAPAAAAGTAAVPDSDPADAEGGAGPSGARVP